MKLPPILEFRTLPTKALTVAAAAALVVAIGEPASAAPSATVAWGTTTSAPAGFRANLMATATTGPTDVWAVGADNPDSSFSQVLDRPYAEHWNGSAWSATPVPMPTGSGTEDDAKLTGAAAIAPNDAWAVGDSFDPSFEASQTLADHWNGQAWTQTITPNPAGISESNHLLAVAARTTNDVWAVGSTGYPDTSLVIRWNGSAWAPVAVPDIGALRAVAVDAASVWVAGDQAIERFDGSRWIRLPAPPVTAGTGASLALRGLAATAMGLWAVGDLETTVGEGGGATRSYAAVFNGTAWTMVGVAGSGLAGVAGSGDTVLAAAPNDGAFRLSTNGSSPEITPAPGTVYPDAIATDPTGNAWAVGFSPTNGTLVPGIIDAPGIGQGGIIVDTGAANATVTWTGPVNHSGTTDFSGRFAAGGLPDGTYTVIASVGGCAPGVATVAVTAGVATAVTARVSC